MMVKENCALPYLATRSSTPDTENAMNDFTEKVVPKKYPLNLSGPMFWLQEKLLAALIKFASCQHHLDGNICYWNILVTYWSTPTQFSFGSVLNYVTHTKSFYERRIHWSRGKSGLNTYLTNKNMFSSPAQYYETWMCSVRLRILEIISTSYYRSGRGERWPSYCLPLSW